MLVESLTYAEKMSAVLGSGRLKRTGEEIAFRSLLEQIRKGAPDSDIQWQWKAVIDARYQRCVVQKLESH